MNPGGGFNRGSGEGSGRNQNMYGQRGGSKPNLKAGVGQGAGLMDSFQDLLPNEFVAAKSGSQSCSEGLNQPIQSGSKQRLRTVKRESKPIPSQARPTTGGESKSYQSASQWLHSSDNFWGPVSHHSGNSTSAPQVQYLQDWEHQVDIWFSEADVDGDGRVAGDEASTFFRRSGVADESLSEMWQLANGGHNGLNRAQFNTALKLLGALQSGSRLSSDVVASAKAQAFPINWPRVRTLYFPRDELHRVHSSEASTSYSSSPSRSSRPSSPYRTNSMPPGPAPPPWLLSQIDHLGSSKSYHGIDSNTPRPNSICLDGVESGELPDDIAHAAFFCNACLVSAELRLPPLHAKQSAKLKILMGVQGSLMAAPSLHGGMLQWMNVKDGMNRTAGDGLKSASTEDADSARCLEIPGEPGSIITSLAVNEEMGHIWAGHENGMVSTYLIGDGTKPVSSVLSTWRAHRYSAITAMAVTSWGELWTGSSKGSLRIWSDALNPHHPQQGRTLKRADNEKAHGEIHAIVVSACGSIVWSAGQNNICLWAAYGGQFLGRIQTDKVADVLDVDEKNIRINTRQGLETTSNGKVRVMHKFGAKVQSDPEEFDQDGIGFRVAVGHVAKFLGKGVRKAGEKVLSRSQQLPPYIPEDTLPSKFGSIKGMATLPDNTIWIAYKNGFLERYTHNGRFTTRLALGSCLTCICSVGDRLWVGLASGWLSVISHDAKELHKWLAHEEPVCDIAVMGPLTITLGTDGSIKCWSSRIPDKTDSLAWQSLNEVLPQFIQSKSISVLCGTWNVNETRPAPESLRKWLGGQRRVGIADIIIIGLQEIEMGTSSVAKSWAIETLSRSTWQEKGNYNAQWWSHEILDALEHEEEKADPTQRWEKVHMRQMSGIIIYAFARSKFQPYIGNLSSSSVGTGVMGFGGNKGAVAVAFTLYRRRIVVVCSHFAAHQDGVEKRNNDYASIVRQLTFHKHSVPREAPTALVQRAAVSSGQLQRPNPAHTDVHRAASERSADLEEEELGLSRGLQRAELLVWVGDFNYRVDMSYHEALEAIEQNRLRDMLEKDQCRREMSKNRVFHGLREGHIQFQPTYKFDKGLQNPLAYDSSEKMRVPSWTDRIFFRGSKPFSLASTSSGTMVSHASSHMDNLIDIDSSEPYSIEDSGHPDADEICVECMGYNTVISVTDSDHKPVWGLLRVAYPTYTQHKRRQTSYEMLRNSLWMEQPEVSLALSTTSLLFVGDTGKTVTVKNKGSEKALVTISWDKHSHRQMPKWMEVRPQLFILPAGGNGVFHVTTAQSASGVGYRPRRLYANLTVQGKAVMSTWADKVVEYPIEVALRPT